jgi:beta-lactamase regulating signal transducer with metallopeptidase domain
MMPVFSLPFTGQQLIQAISWTLIHSLWQGMLLSIVVGIIIFFTKQSKPALRYNLLAGSLFIFIVTAVVTFSLQLLHATQIVDAGLTITADSINSVQNISVATVTNHSDLPFFSSLFTFFDVQATWIVLIWFIIIAFQFIKLAAGLFNVYQLKTKKVFSVNDYWNDKIADLCSELKINKSVRLLVSGITKMPSVVGVFKPVILFPAAMLASLPANEIEAILVHELAHIARKDFLVNLLQHVVEIIFFFNPAVLWVSSLIKQERENCCDDIAVIKMDNKRSYIDALLSFQNFNELAVLPLASSFLGEKNNLINRVKRILYNNNKTLNNMEKKLLIAGAIVTGVFIFAFTTIDTAQKKTPAKAHADAVAVNETKHDFTEMKETSDSFPVKNNIEESIFNGKITKDEDGKKYELTTENGTVKELYINGKRIPADKMQDYSTVTSEILRQVKIDAETTSEDMRKSAIDMEKAKQEMVLSKIEMEKQKENMMSDSKEQMQQAKIEMKREMERAQLEMEKSKNEMAEYQRQMKTDMEKSKLEMEQSKKEMALAKSEMEKSKAQQEGIINDFIKENLINNKKELGSYKLSNDELIVNGVKQSDALHKKFADKYLKGKQTITYNNTEVIK